jgi:hypothetical protein
MSKCIFIKDNPVAIHEIRIPVILICNLTLTMESEAEKVMKMHDRIRKETAREASMK